MFFACFLLTAAISFSLYYFGVMAKTTVHFKFFTLEPFAAIIFFSLLMFITVPTALFCLYATYRGLTLSQEVTLTDTYIRTPKNGFSTIHRTIRYDDIYGINYQKVGAQEIISIHHHNQKTELLKQMCRNKAEFESLRENLVKRVDDATSDWKMPRNLT
ncbi:hypothetical protein [Polycladidibacter stylochi]|uniref:hypothetical protein n=1 Tax=Polycladidibacter stylochi TaxID=1807766 RepID=UPI0008315331|nr:hypothetical protein [Pseudovibrio stylochi]